MLPPNHGNGGKLLGVLGDVNSVGASGMFRNYRSSEMVGNISKETAVEYGFESRGNMDKESTAEYGLDREIMNTRREIDMYGTISTAKQPHPPPQPHPPQPHQQPQQQQQHSATTIDEVVSPISTEMLRPIRQKTRNVVFNILEDQTVVMEFLEHSNGIECVVEVVKISCDGMKVSLYCPTTQDQSAGVEVGEKPVAVPRSVRSYDYDMLPRELWQKYQVASNFVSLVKMRTPKVCWNNFCGLCFSFCVSWSNMIPGRGLSRLTLRNLMDVNFA